MVLELCSGPCIALEVKCNDTDKTVSQFRKLVGPMDSVRILCRVGRVQHSFFINQVRKMWQDIAKIIRPDTIRARFGKTKIQNSVHVTDLVEDASKEVNRWIFY